MCGIVGYIGEGDAKEVILEGLEKLEYRGYDSAGIAILKDDIIQIVKKSGKLSILNDYLEKNPISGNLGIGHTRWATHGAPTESNSHPHYSEDRKVVVVHNGIIENYQQLKKGLIEKGYKFESETDTEVIAHLYHSLYKGNSIEALKNLIQLIRGSYALGIIHSDNKDELLCCRNESPLIIGIGENENFIASDVPALLKYTKKVHFLENGDYGKITKSNIELYDINNNLVEREVNTIEWTLEQATKGGYEHFMIKEIHEQPETLRQTLERVVNYHDYSINFEEIIKKDELEKIENIHIIACGTAYHAGLQGEYMIEKIAKLPVATEIASEFRYSNPFVDKKSLCIFVSQSGETLDTILAMKECKKRGAMTLAITNVVGSTISRDADKVIYTMAGPEIGVASTKAYTNQVLNFFLLAIYFAELKECLSSDEKKLLLEEVKKIPQQIEVLLEDLELIKETSEYFKNVTNGFYIGRGLDYKVALEGSLKMKEVSYIHTESLPAGELKHGTIALIEEGLPTVVLCTQTELLEKSVSNIRELKSRGSYIISVTNEENTEVIANSDVTLLIPKTIDILSGLLSVIPLQLLAYYTSLNKGIDVDKPRNLAKSVTVE